MRREYRSEFDLSYKWKQAWGDKWFRVTMITLTMAGVFGVILSLV